MKRLHELTAEQLEAWRVERLRVGQEKYGNAHLQRYGAVDIAEELLDAINIMTLLEKRVSHDENNGVTLERPPEYIVAMGGLRSALVVALNATKRVDETLTDDFCTDERGGERIWWSEHAGSDDDG